MPEGSGRRHRQGAQRNVTSGPSDNWITSDGAYLYQIYGNASKLVGYATQSDGSLNGDHQRQIPYNSSAGLGGFLIIRNGWA